MYNRAQLQAQMAQMGLRPNDTVVIHTSMRAIGAVENGAHGVIDAFCDYLCEGLFVVPTHTWANVNAQNPFYNVRTTPPCIGALPAAAAFRSDGVRSLHPTHSVWAHGRDAQAFVAGEETAVTPAPPNGCWARLADRGAKILLIGVGNDKNTFIHSVDELAELPDRLQAEPYTITVTDAAGGQRSVAFRGHYCSRSSDVSVNYVNFEKPMLALGAQTFGQLGNAAVRVVDAAMCRDIVLRIYTRGGGEWSLARAEIPEHLYL